MINIGKPRLQNKMELNLEDEYGVYGYGICNNTGNKFYFDMDVYDIIKNYCWIEHICKRSEYRELRAYDRNTKKVVKMTTLLGYQYYDHEDHNTLNNRRYNLRPATYTENNRNASKRKDNTSGVIGVNWNKNESVWVARISINGNRKVIGKFIKKIDAIKARLKAEKEFYKEFAPQKNLFQQYDIE